jgi:T-complex protein 1 subunit beta
MEKTAQIEEAEKDKMRAKCQKIIDHKIDVFINRQLIYNFPEQIFSEAGISSIEHADFDGIEALGAVLGAEIVSTFDQPELVTLGHCDLVRFTCSNLHTATACMASVFKWAYTVISGDRWRRS